MTKHFKSDLFIIYKITNNITYPTFPQKSFENPNISELGDIKDKTF